VKIPPVRLVDGTTLGRARRLRRDQTDAERKLWKLLRGRNLGLKFRRQYPIGSFIADFCCIERRLIVELDGSQHATGTEADGRLADLSLVRERCSEAARHISRSLGKRSENAVTRR
jgi:very-short-patch-repair endonuclease